MKNEFKLKNHQIINNRYQVKKIIGKGGIGKTYLALDKKSKTEVVLKVLVFKEAGDWKKIELFERETKALKNLEHEQIPDYIDNFEMDIGDQHLFVLVQEYIAGSNFFDHIKNGKRFSLDEVHSIFQSLLEVCIYIHGIFPRFRNSRPNWVSWIKNP